MQNDGRVKPLDTLAEELVNLVTGRSHWTDPDAKPAVAYSAPELLFGWITQPEAWIDRPILRCEYRPLRKILNTDKVKLPVEGTFVALGQILDWKQSNESGRTRLLVEGFRESPRRPASARPANRPTAWETRPKTARSTPRWPSCSATWSRF